VAFLDIAKHGDNRSIPEGEYTHHYSSVNAAAEAMRHLQDCKNNFTRKCHHVSSKRPHVRARRRWGRGHELGSDGQRRGRRRAPHVGPDAHRGATVKGTLEPTSPAAIEATAMVRDSTRAAAAAAAPPATVVTVVPLATPSGTAVAALFPAVCPPLLVVIPLLVTRGVVSAAGVAAGGAAAPGRLVAVVVGSRAVPGRVGRIRHGLIVTMKSQSFYQSTAQANKQQHRRSSYTRWMDGWMDGWI
jgi:hypothetical protein